MRIDRNLGEFIFVTKYMYMGHSSVNMRWRTGRRRRRRRRMVWFCCTSAHTSGITTTWTLFNSKRLKGKKKFCRLRNWQSGNWLIARKRTENHSSNYVPTPDTANAIGPDNVCVSIVQFELDKNIKIWTVNGLTFLLLLKTEHLNVSVLPSRAI